MFCDISFLKQNIFIYVFSTNYIAQTSCVLQNMSVYFSLGGILYFFINFTLFFFKFNHMLLRMKKMNKLYDFLYIYFFLITMF